MLGKETHCPPPFSTRGRHEGSAAEARSLSAFFGITRKGDDEDERGGRHEQTGSGRNRDGVTAFSLMKRRADRARHRISGGRILQKKIGILTFHRCINYGSYWQARCLAEGLQPSGKNVSLLDHKSKKVDRAEWRCALQPLRPVPTRRSDYPLYAAKMRKFLYAIEDLPLSESFSLEDPADMEGYDLVIVGSDEVWNLRHPWYGGTPLFYGEGLRSSEVAAYAASFGNQPASPALETDWAEKLRRFSRISIRDENSRRLIEEALCFEPDVVLDPCLQFPAVVEASVRGSRCAPEFVNDVSDGSYTAVYGHTFPDWFSQRVRRWAASRGSRLISIGYRNDWVDQQFIEAGPEEFARFMAGADAVATNFFHGCIFALLNDKPFACVGSAYRSNKLRGLTELVGARKHLVEEDAPETRFAEILGEALEPAILSRIRALRQQSHAYLDDVIN